MTGNDNISVDGVVARRATADEPAPFSLDVIELDQRIEFSALMYQRTGNNDSCFNFSCGDSNNTGSCTNTFIC